MEDDDSRSSEFDDIDDDNDDDDEEPLSQGIDSVSWLPSVKETTTINDPSAILSPGQEVLPLFPLGGIVYTPNSEHILNIFEPRYRQMYSDILLNGSKRFVVCMSHPTDAGRFAQTGVLFELQDLKEVSEQTSDAIKYICNHKVTGRVRMDRIINPNVWESRESYLKVIGTITYDNVVVVSSSSSSSSSNSQDENGSSSGAGDEVYGAFMAKQDEVAFRNAFGRLVELQHEVAEDVRFTKESAVGTSLAVADGPGPDGLWQTIRLWQSFLDKRLQHRQGELQRDFQSRLQDFLRKQQQRGDDANKDTELPSAINFTDLSPALQRELKELQTRMAAEMEPVLLEQQLTMQKILEAETHSDRCRLMKHFVDVERKRLEAKRTLQGMFTSSGDSTAGSSSSSTSGGSKGIIEQSSASNSDIPKEEQLPSSSEDDDTTTSTLPPSSFFSDEDAFQ